MAVEMFVEKGINYAALEVTDQGVVRGFEDIISDAYDTDNPLPTVMKWPTMYGRFDRIVDANLAAREREIELEDFYGDAFRAIEVGVVGIYELAGSTPESYDPMEYRKAFYEEMIDRADISAKLNIQIPRSQADYEELATSLDGEEGVTQLLKNPMELMARLRAYTQLEDKLSEFGIEISKEQQERQRKFEKRIAEQISYALIHAQTENFRRETNLSQELTVLENLVDQLLFGEEVTVEFYSIHDNKDNTVKRITKPVEKLPGDLPEPLPEYDFNNERPPEPHRLRAHRLITGGYGIRKERKPKQETAAVEKEIRTAILEAKPIRPENAKDNFRMKLIILDSEYVNLPDESNPNITTVNNVLQTVTQNRLGERVAIQHKHAVSHVNHTHGSGFSRQRIYVNFLDKPIAFNPNTGEPEDYACIEIILNSFARESDNTIGPASHHVYVVKRSEVVANDIYGSPKQPVDKATQLQRNLQVHRGIIVKEALQPREQYAQFMDYEDHDGKIYTVLMDQSNPDDPRMIAKILKPLTAKPAAVIFDRSKSPALMGTR